MSFPNRYSYYDYLLNGNHEIPISSTISGRDHQFKIIDIFFDGVIKVYGEMDKKFDTFLIELLKIQETSISVHDFLQSMENVIPKDLYIGMVPTEIQNYFLRQLRHD
jgi:hypothetical protein